MAATRVLAGVSSAFTDVGNLGRAEACADSLAVLSGRPPQMYSEISTPYVPGSSASKMCGTSPG